MSMGRSSQRGAHSPDYVVKTSRTRPDGRQVWEKVGVAWRTDEGSNGLRAKVILHVLPIPTINKNGAIETSLLFYDFEERGDEK